MLSTGGALDIVWIFGAPILRLTLVAAWASLLNLAYDTWFDAAELDLPSVIGTFGTAVVAFVLTDFLMWFTHWARHKVPTFWYFHAVHHAAPTLNALTDNRVHFVEAIIAAHDRRAAGAVARPRRPCGDRPGHRHDLLHRLDPHRRAHEHGPAALDPRHPAVPPRAPLVRPRAPRHELRHRLQLLGHHLPHPVQGMGRVPGDRDRRPRLPPRASRHAGSARSARTRRQNVYPFTQIARDIGKFRRPPVQSTPG